MHLLRRLRPSDASNLSELRRRTGATAKAPAGLSIAVLLMDNLQNSVSSATRLRVALRLRELDVFHKITTILAIESGSRAWGFPSRDSDYDIRFIYARPISGYLTLSQGRDVIEVPLDTNGWDIAGWDLRKTLFLALRSNATVGEWLTSPIAYATVPALVEAMLTFLREQYSPRRYALHYFHLAHKYWRERAAGRSNVTDKTYCYVFRSLLATLWTITRRDLVPMNIDDLLAGVEVPVKVGEAFNAVRLRKIDSLEKTILGREPILDGWIIDLLNSLKPVCYALPDREPDWPAGDQLFRWILKYLKDGNE